MNDIKCFKIELFIPDLYLDIIKKVIIDTNVGRIGNYDCCFSYSRVKGVFRPLDGSNPQIGKVNEINEIDELKIEFICSIDKLEETMQSIKKVHPYEEAVINVIPLYK